MANTYNDFTTVDPWMFKSTDSWFPDAFSKETETALTNALTQSLFTPFEYNLLNQTSDNYYFNNNNTTTTTTTTPSNSTVTGSGSGSVSGSDPEPQTPASKGSKVNLGVSNAKTTKRKSRVSKKSMTTFIQADPGSFRSLVQEVTGVKVPVSELVKPEPVRELFVNKFEGLLPTLDTSAFFVGVQGRNNYRSSDSGSGYNTLSVNGFSQVEKRSQGKVNGGGGNDFYSFCNFPTLESSI